MKFFKRVLLLFVIIILIILIYLFFSGYIMYKDALSEKSIEDRVNSLRNKDFYTKYEELPDYYIDAVICVEDHKFFDHHGVDLFYIARALFNDLIAMKPVEGGSTITQQLAKNLVFTQEKTIYRKIAELLATHDLEKKYSKEEIFELYVNKMYFGNGYYNIHDASYGYYKKAPKDLTLYEATLLAGVPNAPSVYAPTVNLELAEKRQVHVLNKMIEYGKLSEENAKYILSQQKSNAY